MLDFFRRQRSRLKWIWIVLIFVFSVTLVTLYIPVTDLGHVHFFTGNVAEVDGEVVSAQEFQAAYNSYVHQIGAEMTPEMLQAFGYDVQLIDSLIDQRVLVAEAKRLGLDVSAAEIQTRILENPNFREGGRFIGLTRYQDLLVQNGLTVAEFEEGIRTQILMEKLTSLLTAPMTISDHEVAEEYRYRNESVQLDYFILDGPSLESQVTTTADELRDHFARNAATYTIPERRNARYVFLDTVALRTQMEVSEDELRAYYTERQYEYEQPLRITAQHILFRTDGKTPEEVAAIRERATDVLERAKAGEDFAALARQYSEDATAASGGDLGSFGLGQMVAPFEQAAFSLEPGATSDLVTTDFGVHIIRVNERQEARTRPFEEMRAGIESIVRFQKANELAERTAQSIALDLSSGQSPADVVAAYENTTVRETGVVALGDPVEGLADANPVINRIFALSLEETAAPIPIADGYVIPTLIQIEERRPATFEEAEADVRADLRAEKSRELARERTEQARALLAEGRSLQAAAQAVGAAVQSTGWLQRDGFITGFGSTSSLDPQIFNLAPGVVGAPVTTGDRMIAFAVTARQEVDAAAQQANFEALKAELLDAKRSRLLSGYAVEARSRMEREGLIRINREIVQDVVEGYLHVH